MTTTTSRFVWHTCTLILFAGSVGSLETALASETPPIGTNIGQAYPDFTLPRIDGTTGNLSDYRGKKTLLIQFASW